MSHTYAPRTKVADGQPKNFYIPSLGYVTRAEALEIARQAQRQFHPTADTSRLPFADEAAEIATRDAQLVAQARAWRNA